MTKEPRVDGFLPLCGLRENPVASVPIRNRQRLIRRKMRENPQGLRRSFSPTFGWGKQSISDSTISDIPLQRRHWRMAWM